MKDRAQPARFSSPDRTAIGHAGVQRQQFKRFKSIVKRNLFLPYALYPYLQALLSIPVDEAHIGFLCKVIMRPDEYVLKRRYQ